MFSVDKPPGVCYYTCMMYRTITCSIEGCGQTREARSSATKYCEDCARKLKRQRKRTQLKRRRDTDPEFRKKQSMKHQARRKRYILNNPEKWQAKKARYKERLKQDPERRKLYDRRKQLREYGLSPQQHKSLVDRAGGRCGICRQEFGKRGPHVDHDHATGLVRGILCHCCNLGIGLFRDDPERLRAAINYLEISKLI
jgi:hypothetical protein